MTSIDYEQKINLGNSRIRLGDFEQYTYQRAYDDGLSKGLKINEEMRQNEMEWEHVYGELTPGGDPLFICPNCHDMRSRHINGIESHEDWNFCPYCGQKLKYMY